MTAASAVMAAADAPDYTGQAFILLGIALTAILGWVGSILVKRMREPVSVATMLERLDALTKEVYGDEKTKTPGLREEIGEARRVGAAMGRIIASLARQWPGDHVPRLNPDDLAELDEDTLPVNHPWRVRP